MIVADGGIHISEEGQRQLEQILRETRVCAICGAPTDRYILFSTAVGMVEAYECIDCRQKRVQAQVDAGLRPASDLLPDSLPEVRNPA